MRALKPLFTEENTDFKEEVKPGGKAYMAQRVLRTSNEAH